MVAVSVAVSVAFSAASSCQMRFAVSILNSDVYKSITPLEILIKIEQGFLDKIECYFTALSWTFSELYGR